MHHPEGITQVPRFEQQLQPTPMRGQLDSGKPSASTDAVAPSALKEQKEAAKTTGKKKTTQAAQNKTNDSKALASQKPTKKKAAGKKKKNQKEAPTQKENKKKKNNNKGKNKNEKKKKKVNSEEDDEEQGRSRRNNEENTVESDDDSDENSDDGLPEDEDVCFEAEEHPGTEVFLKAVRKSLKKLGPIAYSPKVYRAIKKQLHDRRFFVCDDDDNPYLWREVTKSELIDFVWKSYEEEKSNYI
jgi:hypothetical protein